MKKILSLFAVVAIAMVACFSFTSCEKDDFTSAYAIEIDGEAGTNIVNVVIDSVMVKIGNNVGDTDVFTIKGKESENNTLAKQKFQAACKEVEDSYKNRNSIYVLNTIKLNLKYMNGEKIIDSYQFTYAGQQN